MPNRLLRPVLTSLATAAVLALPVAAQPKQPGGTPTTPNGPVQPGTAAAPSAELFPEAATLPAPDWIKPGLTLTWSMTSMSGNVQVPVFKPNADTPAIPKLQSTKGNKTGAALIQDYVLAVEPKRVVIIRSVYDKPNLGGLVLAKTQVILGSPGAPGLEGTHWVNPKAFDGPLKRTAEEFKTLQEEIRTGKKPADHTLNRAYRRGPITLSGTPYDAVAVTDRTVTNGQQSAERMLTYDADSGVLLNAALGQKQPNRGMDAFITAYLDFLGSDTVALPWANDPLPAWTQTLNTLTYTVTTSSVFQGMPTQGKPVTLEMTPELRGPDYLILNAKPKGQQGTQGGSGQKIAAGSNLIGLVLPASAANRLRKGQVLLNDRFTGSKTHVEYVGPLDNGQPGFMLVTTDANSTTQSIYESTRGLMVYQRSTTQDPSGMTVVRETTFVRHK
ncbi:MAG: hypothetical protein AAF797_04985 [Planctomycetota bacterium]